MGIFNLFGFISSKLSEKRNCQEIDVSKIRLIVGLGNPGRQYEGTRHNVGFEAIDLLADLLVVDVKKKKFGGLFGECEFEGKKLIFLKPQEYMNRSGQAVATVVGFYKLPIENILVVTDCMDIEPGRIRLRAKGSAGGHNGLRDIIAKLGTSDFARLRIGIGKSDVIAGKDFVLSKISGDDKELIEKAKAKAKQAVVCWLGKGITAAMNEFNEN